MFTYWNLHCFSLVWTILFEAWTMVSSFGALYANQWFKLSKFIQALKHIVLDWKLECKYRWKSPKAKIGRKRTVWTFSDPQLWFEYKKQKKKMAPIIKHFETKTLSKPTVQECTITTFFFNGKKLYMAFE